jgi:hypothetical protein
MWFVQAIIVAARRHTKIQQQKEQQRRNERKRFIKKSILKMQRSFAATAAARLAQADDILSETKSNDNNTSNDDSIKISTNKRMEVDSTKLSDIHSKSESDNGTSPKRSPFSLVRYIMPNSQETTLPPQAHTVARSAAIVSNQKDVSINDDKDDNAESKENYNLLKIGTDYFYIPFFFVQMLMLPVGFYVYLYNIFFATVVQHKEPSYRRRRIIEETIQITHWSCYGDDVQKRNNDGTGNKGIGRFLSLLQRQQHNLQKNHCREVYTTRTSISLSHAIINNIAIAMSIRMRPIIKFFKSKSKNLVHRNIRHILGNALRHPLTYHTYYMKLLRFIRWMNYLIPILSKLPMLQDNCVDLYKKYKQRRHAMIAQNVRKLYKRQLSRASLENYSATYVQKTYRAYMQRKYMSAAIQFHDMILNDSVIRIQNAFRAALQRARARIQLKQLQLQKLKEQQQQQQRQLQQSTTSFDESDRFCVEALEYDVNKYLNEKLLLRPNTRRAIIWKFVVVTAMIAEIVFLLVLPPLLSTYKTPLVRHKVPVSNHSQVSSRILPASTESTSSTTFDIEAALRALLVPVPVVELPQCHVEERMISINRPIQSMQFILFNVAESVHRTISVISRPQKAEITLPRTMPWYCSSKRYRTIQSVYIVTLDLIISNLIYLIGTLCYLDIFVIFFTGKYDPNSGTLVPKPFMERWIVPGLLLQLATNPLMGNTYKYATFIFRKVVYFGPSRTMRWTLALIYPMAKLMSRIIKVVWKKIVQVENEQLLSSHSSNDISSMSKISSVLSINNLPNVLGSFQKQQAETTTTTTKSRKVYPDTNPLRLSCIRRSTTVGTNMMGGAVTKASSSNTALSSMSMNRSPSLRYIHSKTKLFPGSHSTCSFAKTFSSIRLPATDGIIGSSGSVTNLTLPKVLSTIGLSKHNKHLRNSASELLMQYQHGNYDSRPDLFAHSVDYAGIFGDSSLMIQQQQQQEHLTTPNLIPSFDSSSNIISREWSSDDIHNNERSSSNTNYYQQQQYPQQLISSLPSSPIHVHHRLYQQRFGQITEQQESNVSGDSSRKKNIQKRKTIWNDLVLVVIK